MELKEFVLNNPKLVKMKESVTYPGLFVVKYNRSVFYNNLWNDFLVECRGLVVDKDFNPVIRPFTKIFNRFERDTDIDRDDMVLAVQKVNGFMAAATYVPSLDKVVVSTTGSLDSDFVKMAEEYITEDMKAKIAEISYINPHTFLFEIVHPSDPHIIKEEAGAYLIGARMVSMSDAYESSVSTEYSLDSLASMLGCMRPLWSELEFSTLVERAKTVKHEGFVVYSIDTPGKFLKIKSPFYLISKFLGRCGENKIDHILSHPDWVNWDTIDEEFFPLIRHLTENKDTFLALDEQNRIAMVQKYIKESIYV